MPNTVPRIGDRTYIPAARLIPSFLRAEPTRLRNGFKKFFRLSLGRTSYPVYQQSPEGYIPESKAQRFR
ncbi:MAG: hypothetical protein MH252_01165 [Thermosynechococcaceae cyanobacterium MS004]|nr:hypothetical protein [Thermosynechococcaceae cyanobacterium MS004]